jgi:4-hydroxyphenylpyruvate dioxygenase
LETGERDFATHVIKNGDIIFAFKSPLNPSGHSEFAKHLELHGDGVKDVAFTVDDSEAIYKKAVKNGAIGVMKPTLLRDEGGSVVISSV